MGEVRKTPGFEFRGANSGQRFCLDTAIGILFPMSNAGTHTVSVREIFPCHTQ